MSAVIDGGADLGLHDGGAASRRHWRAEIRKTRRLLRQTRLELSDPEKARRFEVERKTKEAIEDFAEQFGVAYWFAKHLLTDPGVGFDETLDVNRFPAFGWVATTGAKVHLARQWVIRPGGSVRVRTACDREMTVRALPEATVDGLCRRCREDEPFVLDWFKARAKPPKTRAESDEEWE